MNDEIDWEWQEEVPGRLWHAVHSITGHIIEVEWALDDLDLYEKFEHNAYVCTHYRVSSRIINAEKEVIYSCKVCWKNPKIVEHLFYFVIKKHNQLYNILQAKL